jgi:hypothetical protein
MCIDIKNSMRNSVAYVTLSDLDGNRISIPNDDWDLLQQRWSLSLSTDDLINKIQFILYCDSAGYSRFCHEW